MCFIREEIVSMKLKTGLMVMTLAGAGVLLASCADQGGLDREWRSMEFGRAVHEDMAAQIADPDAAYKGPPPPENGARAELATKRYEAGKVINPQAPSSMAQIQGGGGGGGGGGGSTGP
jgi:hypothetical protein